MDQLLFEDPTMRIISYIITVVIGGVGFKFYQLWLSHSEKEEEREVSSNQTLINNLTQRVEKLSARVDQLETEKEEVHKREIQRATELAESRAQVEILKNRLKDMEQRFEELSILIKKYRQRYGPLTADDFHEKT